MVLVDLEPRNKLVVDTESFHPRSWVVPLGSSQRILF